MSNINNITSKILRDSEVERDSILAAANGDKEKTVSKAIVAGNEAEREILEKAKAEAKSKKDRIISGAKLKVRNDKLAEKQSLIEEVLSLSINKLTSISSDEFVTFVKSTILSLDIEGDENLLLNHEGLKVIGTDVVDDINAELKNKGSKGEITLNRKEANFKGGFILEKNGIEVNYTYESLISSYRDELEVEIAKVLFN